MFDIIKLYSNSFLKIKPEALRSMYHSPGYHSFKLAENCMKKSATKKLYN